MIDHKTDDTETLRRGYELAVAQLRQRCETLRVQLREAESILRDLEANALSPPAVAGKRLSLPQILARALESGTPLTFDELHARAHTIAGRPIHRTSLRVTIAKLIRGGTVTSVGSGPARRFKATSPATLVQR